jgi:hypothetical protein
MARDTRPPNPAPGWTPGTCYCGCQTKLKTGQRWWASRTHRSSRAPDGRPVTEVDTKFCQTCATRLPHEEFPLKTVKRKAGYVQRRSFYCEGCESQTLQQLAEQAKTPEGRAKNRERMHLLYQDPIFKERHKAQTKDYRQRAREDPEKAARMRRQKHRYWLRYKKTKKYEMMCRRRRVREFQLKQDRLDPNPLVVPRGDPMLEWLYRQIDLYSEERGLSPLEVVGPVMGGRNWQKWRASSRSHGGKYMPLRIVDAVLVRLDLPHRLNDFDFKRRSELKYHQPRVA